MAQSATSAAQGCIFCAIVARQADASVVYEDETAVAFMDLNPVTPGHLLVAPRKHAVGLEDLHRAAGAHVWSVGHDMSRALRRSDLRCEGINVFLCDGEVAFQTVFHLHLHVIRPLVTSRTDAVNAGCVHYKSTKSASWSQASSLGTKYGWSFVSHTATYPTGDLSKLSSAQATPETGSDHHSRASGGHGLIAYPGTATGILAIQQQYGARCFAWGRKYGNNGLTRQSAGTIPPYWQRTMAVDGGSCNDPAAACYNTPGAVIRYDAPANVIAAVNALQPGQWMTIQAYVLVTGTNPPYTSSTLRWNCASSNPALHWSNDERPLLDSDAQVIIGALAARAIPTKSPLEVGIAFGRPATYP